MVSGSEAVVLAVPQDVQVSLRNCPLKIPTRVVKIPTGSVKILMCFCENSNAFGENPGMFVIYLPQDRWLCLWELCLGCLVCREGPWNNNVCGAQWELCADPAAAPDGPHTRRPRRGAREAGPAQLLPPKQTPATEAVI